MSDVKEEGGGSSDGTGAGFDLLDGGAHNLRSTLFGHDSFLNPYRIFARNRDMAGWKWEEARRCSLPHHVPTTPFLLCFRPPPCSCCPENALLHRFSCLVPGFPRAYLPRRWARLPSRWPALPVRGQCRLVLRKKRRLLGKKLHWNREANDSCLCSTGSKQINARGISP